MPYFQVDDCDGDRRQGDALAAARFMCRRRTFRTSGRFAILADPQGAMFAVIKITQPS